MVEEEGLAEEEEAREGEGSKEEEDPVEEEEVPVAKKKSRAGTSETCTRPSMGPMFEILTMTENDIPKIYEKYQILDHFLLRAARLEDWVSSGLVSCLTMYEEDLCASLHFSLHPLIWDVLQC